MCQLLLFAKILTVQALGAHLLGETPCLNTGCRLILAYPEQKGRMLQEGYDTNRLQAIEALTMRVNERLYRFTEGDEKNSFFLESSPSLETQYLSGLNMEIVSLPYPLTGADGLQLANDLPGVLTVFPDVIREYALEKRSHQLLPTATRRKLRGNIIRTNYDEETTDSSTSVTSSSSSADIIPSSSDNIKSDEDPSSITSVSSSSSSSSSDDISHEDLDVLLALLDRETGASNGTTPPKWPHDPLLKFQWYYRQDNPYGIQAETVWNERSNGSVPENITIALIDSGCDITHPELQGKLWKNPNENCDNGGDGIDNDNNGYVDDCIGWDFALNNNKPVPERSGHGTSAAGIIVAEADNRMGMAGICWNCRVMCLKFISGTTGRVADQIAAIDYAVRQGAKISNNSYGGYGLAGAEYLAIMRAQKAGHLFVASAGNNNRNTDLPSNPHSPSVYPLDNIIAVGASTSQGAKANFSNYGKKTVDLFAPGQSILTTAEGGAYSVVSGTSFASPMVAGAAGVIWSTYPNLTYLEVIDALVGSCTNFLNKTFNGITRCNGILNLPKALERAKALEQHSVEPFAAHRESPFDIVIVADENDD